MRGQHRVAGHHEADREKQHGLDLLDQRVEHIGQNALERRAALVHRSDDSSQAWLGQHDAGGGFRDVGRGRDRDADLRLTQRRRVVGAVAAHADRVARRAETPSRDDICPRENAGKHRVIRWRDAVGNRAGGQTGPSRPTWRAIDAGGPGASPVTITVTTPEVPQLRRSAAPESARGGSLKAMQARPTRCVLGGPQRPRARDGPALVNARARLGRADRRRRSRHGAKAPLTTRHGLPSAVMSHGFRDFGRGIEGREAQQLRHCASHGVAGRGARGSPRPPDPSRPRRWPAPPSASTCSASKPGHAA